MNEENEQKAVIPVSMTSKGVALNNIDEAWRFCDAIQRSGVAPKGMGDTAKIFAVVMAGSELGLSPFRSLSNMKIINGRVGPMGALAKALVRSAGVLAPGTGFKEDFIGEEGTDEFAARIVTMRKGEAERYRTLFSVKDAKLAGLWGRKTRGGEPTPWVTYPKRMLMWRAVGFHMDDYYSDVIMGMHIAEVLEDYPEERIATVIEPVEKVSDPLLDRLEEQNKIIEQAEATADRLTDEILEAELEETAATMQPPADESPGYEDLREDGGLPEAQDPLAGMTEAEAREDLIRDGVIKEEDLEPANPNNSAKEGEDQEPLF